MIEITNPQTQHVINNIIFPVFFSTMGYLWGGAIMALNLTGRKKFSNEAKAVIVLFWPIIGAFLILVKLIPYLLQFVFRVLSVGIPEVCTPSNWNKTKSASSTYYRDKYGR